MTGQTMEVIEHHQRNLDRAIDFLKFAEAKNGAAIAFASALILATLQLRSELVNLKLHELAGCVFALVAALICARSFIPVMNWRLGSSKKSLKNILFFGDIAEMSASEYSQQLADSLPNEASLLIENYAVQTTTVSRIASAKMKSFALAAMLLAIGALLLTFSIFVEFTQRIM